MSFISDFSALNAVFLSSLDGRTATYNGALNVPIFETSSFAEQALLGNARIENYDTLIMVNKTDVAAPAHGDTVIIGAITYKVIKVDLSDEAGMWLLHLSKEA